MVPITWPVLTKMRHLVGVDDRPRHLADAVIRPLEDDLPLAVVRDRDELTPEQGHGRFLLTVVVASRVTVGRIDEWPDRLSRGQRGLRHSSGEGRAGKVARR